MVPFFPGVFHEAGIYAIVHVLSGTRYIGQSRDLLRRFEQHWELLQSAKHHNPRLQKMWDGDGPDAFEFKVVERAPRELEGKRLQRWLATKEGLHIKTFKMRGLAFNILDAEVVPVSTAYGREKAAQVAPMPKAAKFGEHSKPETANPVDSIEIALRDVSLEIDRLKKVASSTQAAALNHRNNVLPRMRSDASPRLFGLMQLISTAEVKRLQVARAALNAANENQTRLDEAAMRAKVAHENSLARRQSLLAEHRAIQN